MNNLVVKSEKAVQIAQRLGVQTAIKPLEREVFLQDVFVSDVFACGERLLKLKTGAILSLRREPQPYDEWVVGVFDGEERLGELAEFDEEIFAHLLDAGKRLVASVKNAVVTPEYGSLEISVKMIDF